MEELWKTKIGSHLWQMNHKDSDNDFFAVHIAPSAGILDGSISKLNSEVMKVKGDDFVSHEIGRAINEIIKGNINFLTATMSTLVENDRFGYLATLKQLIIDYGQSKACSHSIRGLAMHNYNRYIVGHEGEEKIVKKCGIINRSLLFGINILSGNGFQFNGVSEQTPDDVLHLLEIFDLNLIYSQLPDETDTTPFRDFLYTVRIDELNGNFGYY